MNTGAACIGTTIVSDMLAGVAPNPAASGGYDVVGRVAALTSSVARVGLGRLYANLSVTGLPARERDEVRASTTAGSLRSTMEEYARANDSMAQAASLRNLGDKPLMILSAGVGSAANWPQKQERLATLSTESGHHVVAGASHAGLVADPVHAATTTGLAILEVVESVRTKRPCRGDRLIWGAGLAVAPGPLPRTGPSYGFFILLERPAADPLVPLDLFAFGSANAATTTSPTARAWSDAA